VIAGIKKITDKFYPDDRFFVLIRELVNSETRQLSREKKSQLVALFKPILNNAEQLAAFEEIIDETLPFLKSLSRRLIFSAENQWHEISPIPPQYHSDLWHHPIIVQKNKAEIKNKAIDTIMELETKSIPETLRYYRDWIDADIEFKMRKYIIHRIENLSITELQQIQDYLKNTPIVYNIEQLIQQKYMGRGTGNHSSPSLD
jgi:hypothetical protein